MYAEIVRIFLTKKAKLFPPEICLRIAELFLNLFMCFFVPEIAARKNVTYSQAFFSPEKINYSHLGKAELFSLKKCGGH